MIQTFTPTAASESATTNASTGTTAGARAHARAQAGTITDSMPVVPACTWPAVPEGISPESLTWAETIPGGRYSVKVVGRGTRMRLRDVTGAGCAHLLLWRADAPWERLSVADTVKVPWQAYLGLGHPLLSDQGRVLATIAEDTSGHHDALCGTTTLVTNTEKYGAGQVHSHAPAGRELFTLAAAKHGMTPADVAPSLSFFHQVIVDPDGTLRSHGSAGPDTHVDLIFHLPCTVAVVDTAHPLDPSPTFEVGPVEVLAWTATTDLQQILTDLDDSDPEYRRAVLNSEDAWTAATSERTS